MHSITNWAEKAIVPLYSALEWPHLKYSLQFWSQQYNSINKPLECIQMTAKKVVKELEDMT